MQHLYRIDINCDMGESFGNFKIGSDDAIFPYITSCNIACGFHGGDPLHIENTIKKAMQYGVQIGAHPSYPDLAGFGRRKMELASSELKAIIKYQIAAVKGLTESLGGQVKYVKPHGALYNVAADNEQESTTIIQAILEIDKSLTLLGLAGSAMEKIAQSMNIHFIAEAFADRGYDENGRLLNRNSEGSIIHLPEKAIEQVRSLILEKKVKTPTGKTIEIDAQSICVHGDNPNVEVILQAIDLALKQNKILKSAFETYKKNT